MSRIFGVDASRSCISSAHRFEATGQVQSGDLAASKLSWTAAGCTTTKVSKPRLQHAIVAVTALCCFASCVDSGLKAASLSQELRP